MAINNLNNMLNNAGGKVTGNKSAPAQTSGSVAASNNATQEAVNSASKGAVRQDSVLLTDQAQLLTKMQQKIGSSSTTNQSKVENLKAAIEKGDYTVDAQRVAKKMLDMEAELDKLNK
ncbi:MAG: flagellar biosynthesis anti-sigma factor FlgM [Aeromonadaceae bacterium]